MIDRLEMGLLFFMKHFPRAWCCFYILEPLFSSRGNPLPHQGHLAISGDVLGCCTWGWWMPLASGGYQLTRKN